jgi:hypothetical protein
VQRGQLSAVELQAGRAADRTANGRLAQLPAAALGLADSIYFSLERWQPKRRRDAIGSTGCRRAPGPIKSGRGIHLHQRASAGVTKSPGPAVGVYFYLYVLLDLFSRFMVGWLNAEREAAAPAQQEIFDRVR